MKKQLVPLVICGVVVCLALLLAGGSYAGYKIYQSTVKPANAFKAAAEEMKDYNTAEFEMDMTATYEFDMDGELAAMNQEIEATFEGKGVIDIDNQKMQMDLDMKMMGMNISVKQVIDGDTAYMKMGDEPFQKVTLDELSSDGSGMSLDDVQEQQMWSDLAEDIEYEFIEEDTIDGEEVYYYDVKLTEKDVEKFTDSLLESFVDGFNTGSGGTFELEDDDVSLEGMSYSVWIKKGDSSPVREKLVIENITVNLEGFGKLYVKDVVVEYKYLKLNEAVEIEVPEL